MVTFPDGADDVIVCIGPADGRFSMRWFVSALAFAIMVPIIAVNRSRARKPWWL